jgi:lipopolysaccharide/colanic/teichoic acid biosynthesis glycosyltransferase
MGEDSINVDLAVGVSLRRRRAVDDIIRVCDVIGAILCLMILAPVLPLIALAIRLDSPGSPIFKQKRAGKDGVPFIIYKLRTMCDGAERMCKGFRNGNEPVVKLENDSRITPLGDFLRKYSLDELPQVINILKGDMSFVGPRPCMLREVNAYSEYQRQRLNGKPGLTGLAQINGRSGINFDSIVEYDIYYNKHCCVGLYFRILVKTIPYCLSCKSSY